VPADAGAAIPNDTRAAAIPTDARPVDARPNGDLDARLLDSVFEGGTERVWLAGPDAFVFVIRGGPADRFRSLLPYPPGANEAAIGGRAVAVAEIWHVGAGTLTRVLAKAVRLQPMVCEIEPCTIVELAARIGDDGLLAIADGNCAAALARLGGSGRSGTTFEQYDRAAVPEICRAGGRYAWNGVAFVPSSAGALPGAAKPTFISAPDAPATILGRFFEGSLSPEPVQIWPAAAGAPTFGLFVHSYPAPHSPLVPHRPGTELWASGRSIQVAEVWAAGPGSLRRVFRLPVGLAALAEPNVVVDIRVEVDGDELRVGNPAKPCAPDPSLAPDAAGAALDREVATGLCAGRGRYRWNGTRFDRAH
jgi:hypothetical protein